MRIVELRADLKKYGKAGSAAVEADTTGLKALQFDPEVADGSEPQTADSDALRSSRRRARCRDGSGTSFLSRREGDEQTGLYVIPRDGGEARRIVGHDTNIGAYAWRPDGRRVAFLATEARASDQREVERKGFNQIVW
jgi:dipeptidyl aminopeptidase/acylaminoacyl peptidase